MKIKKQMILRKIAGESVLVPIGSSVADTNGLFMLTETAAFIWSCLSQAETAEELAERLTEEYDVAYQEAKEDVDNFLSLLTSYEII